MVKGLILISNHKNKYPFHFPYFPNPNTPLTLLTRTVDKHFVVDSRWANKFNLFCAFAATDGFVFRQFSCVWRQLNDGNEQFYVGRLCCLVFSVLFVLVPLFRGWEKLFMSALMAVHPSTKSKRQSGGKAINYSAQRC